MPISFEAHVPVFRVWIRRRLLGLAIFSRELAPARSLAAAERSPAGTLSFDDQGAASMLAPSKGETLKRLSPVLESADSAAGPRP
jgi:hypothetical protein